MNPVQNRILVLAAVAAAITVPGCTRKPKTAAVPVTPAPTVSSTPAQSPAPAPTTARRAEPASTPAAANTPRYPDAQTRARIDELLARISDAYFDYNQSTLREDAQKTLNADATELRNILKDYPDYKLTIEGHCDERGSAEYNLGLGDRRAAAAKEYLVQIGIPSPQMNLVSYGKERPACTEHDEACWQKNRRIHIVAMASR
jgi:peptidoglycan-associated lipoprotein